MARKLDIKFIDFYVKDAKLSLQQIEYAIEESNKTKNPSKSFLSSKRGMIEVIVSLSQEINNLIEEFRLGLTVEQLNEFDEYIKKNK